MNEYHAVDVATFGQRQKWPLRAGGRLIQVNYRENTIVVLVGSGHLGQVAAYYRLHGQVRLCAPRDCEALYTFYL